MTTKEFFTGRVIVFAIVLLLVLGFIIFRTSPASQEMQNPDPSAQTAPQSEAVAFAWSYEKANSNDLDGFPNTNVVLAVTYSDGSVIRRVVDTTPGGCNELSDERAADSVAGLETTQCYSAGGGHLYKVTKGSDAYQVQRKAFEEGQPDYTPPEYQYEVIAEFPLAQ